MFRALQLLISLIFIAGIGLGGLLLWGKQQAEAPGPLASEKTVVLPRGDGLKAIAGLLEREGVISNALLFRAVVRLEGSARQLKAGEYSFAPAISMFQVAALLQSGKTVQRKLTIAEGLQVREIIEQVMQADGLSGEVTAIPAEGSLLPETYHYSLGDSRQSLIDRMQSAMDGFLAKYWPQRQAGLPVTSMEEAVTLASIVEKETAVSSERARIAGVFVNRLRLGMRLQSDPTVSYALTRGSRPLGRELTRGDLKFKDPYNTYVVKGLPPGPIANPGRAALLAVLNPAATKDLYFVADGSGGHAFARSYKEHQANVRKWRRLKRNAN